MEKEDFFEALFNYNFEGEIGHTLVRELSDDKGVKPGWLLGGEPYSKFARLSVYLESKYSITSVGLIQNSHVYVLLEYLRAIGFKDATLKGYISSFRYVYKEHQHLFSDAWFCPTTRVNGKINPNKEKL